MKERTKQILNYFEQGYTMIEVSKILNINYKTVEGIKRRYKINVRKMEQSKANHYYLDNIDCDTKAYILGFFIADGSVGKEGRVSFIISREDEIILQKIKECFWANDVIYYTNQSGVKYRKPQVRYRFTSRKLLDVLQNKYNIHPNKTHDVTFEFPFETIPKDFQGSFIRGLWDGDGSFESHNGTFNPTCCINSKIFAKQVGDMIQENTGLDYKIYEHQGKTCVYYTLRLHANRTNKLEKVQKLYEFLYKFDTISLKRKKDKVIRYLEYRANLDVNKSKQCNA